MFPDPITLSVGGVPKVLPRVAQDGQQAVYSVEEADGSVYKLTNSTSKTDKGRDRTVVRLERHALSANPLVTGQSVPSSVSVTCTVDRGDLVTITEAKNLAIALIGHFTGGTNAYDNVIRALSGEV